MKKYLLICLILLMPSFAFSAEPELVVQKGSTSVLLEFHVHDSSSTVGAGLTGLVFNTASLTCYYYRSGAASAACWKWAPASTPS